MIRKLQSGEYRLYSRKINPKTGKRRNLGTFASRAAAEKHERAVQYFTAFKTYLEERKSPHKAIVAFSGEHEFSGAKMSEASLNGFSSGAITSCPGVSKALSLSSFSERPLTVFAAG